MRQLITMQLVKSNQSLMLDVPKQCPYCATVIRPVLSSDLSTILPYNQKRLIIAVARTPCCERHFFTAHEAVRNESATVFLSSYPYAASAQIPEEVAEMSPRFVQLYNQSFTAEMSNHIELAGSGYRNALEVLIKDYAINVLGADRNEVVKKKLANAIESYLPSVNLKNCADVIRLLGNDYTHYEAKYDGIDFEVLKRYLQIFITAIEADLLMRKPIIDTGRSQTLTPDESQPSAASEPQ